MEITDVRARQCLDSRGNPTVECEVFTDYGFGRALVPSGASLGEKEALELRDGEKRYRGMGVTKAVRNVNEKIAPEILGMDVLRQREIDSALIEMDGTENKERLGANAILSVSMACLKCASRSLRIPLYQYIGGINAKVLPTPMMNVINGGLHAGNELKFQEYMIVPQKKSFSENLRIGVEIYHELKEVIRERFGRSATNVGDEGGYAPPLKNIEEPINLILEASKRLEYQDSIKIAIDVAASHFHKKNKYLLDKPLTSSEMIDFYQELIESYPISSIEDPMDENDWKGFKEVTKALGKKVQIVGDDVFVSNPKILKRGIEDGVCNALLLKVNQIGTVSEALEAASLAFENGYKVVVSHRSGETEDPFIADLAVGINCGQIKTGAPARGERTAKFNQLLRIEEELYKGV